MTLLMTVLHLKTYFSPLPLLFPPLQKEHEQYGKHLETGPNVCITSLDTAVLSLQCRLTLSPVHQVSRPSAL